MHKKQQKKTAKKVVITSSSEESSEENKVQKERADEVVTQPAKNVPKAEESDSDEVV